MEIKIILCLVIGTIAIISAMLGYQEYASLKRKDQELEARIAKLESTKSKRMPYEAMENILDARAALNKEKEEFQFFISLIENAEAHLNKAMTVGTKKEKGE